ncbi:MvdC/MvdD family ATP grasp protein [Algoriphagus resistens]|uniref:MvdC/MvdD family ATP grasp protein n=1 Tax=Algoriphagus resistens TaxID=1750590 RepID=UPI000716C448|nr:hypothetical protein [Algoriphagus resistens]
MTKILLITNKSDITSDFVVRELVRNELDFYRFNTEEICNGIDLILDFSRNQFQIKDSRIKKNVDLKNIKSVYYRRPELPFFDWAELDSNERAFAKNEFIYTLEGIYKLLRDAYWISPLFAIREAENKIYQLDIANQIGFKIPDSLITNSFEDFKNFFDKHNSYNIIKPIKSGLVGENNDSRVVFTTSLASLPNEESRISEFPNYLQSKIDKKGDVRVIVVGNKYFATFIDSQKYECTKIDWRRGERKLEHSQIEIPSSIKEKCKKLLKTLNLKYAAIDFILDRKGNYIFLEINPNGQWAWIENLTGQNISGEIVNLLKNGCNR